MGKQIKLSGIDFAKAGNILVEAGKTVGIFVSNHVPEVLATILAGVTIDNIRVRKGRKNDKKAFVENALKQQQVIRKHDAEINVLKAEAEQAQTALQKVDQLAQIVNNLMEGGASE